MSGALNLVNLFHNETNPVVLEPGETLFKAGDAGDAMYVVLEGEVEMTIHRRVVEVVRPGGLLGEMALVEKLPRVATAVAKTKARLATISERRFTFLVQNHPFFALHVMRVLSQRLRSMDNMIND
jgi:CRP/FNR family transcriptional regulator, cyclic AMP receptor protein